MTAKPPICQAAWRHRSWQSHRLPSQPITWDAAGQGAARGGAT
jgi:hypothetical protein